MARKNEVRRVLDGIDRTEDDKDGWWETSTGAAFGKQKLAEVLALIEDEPVETSIASALTTLTRNWDSPLIPGRSGW